MNSGFSLGLLRADEQHVTPTVSPTDGGKVLFS